MTVRLYIGNLPEEVDRQGLEDLFTSAGEVVSTKIIRDRKTGKCRGFGFLTVNTQEQADQYIEKFNGQTFGETTLKIELAQPRNKGNASAGSTTLESGEESETQDVEKSSPSSTPKPTPAGQKKKRNRSKSSQNREVVASNPAGPDPRWASQLQRIKEQLQAANQ